MSDIIKKIESKPSYISMGAVSLKEIQKAESVLQLKFASDYQEYLLALGVASYYGHEITGICKASRLNVVDVTIAERENNRTVPKNWYVIEQANIDGIVIWQAETGEIYQTAPNAVPLKLCDSLGEYIEM